MSVLKFRAYDGENFWYFTSDVGVFYKHFGGEQSSFDDPLEFSEVLDQGWPVDQWTGQGDIYSNDNIEDHNGTGIIEYIEEFAAFRVNYKNGRCKWFYDYILDGEMQSIKVIGNTYKVKG